MDSKPSGDRFFSVNIVRLCESLEGLASEIEYIAAGHADHVQNCEAWEHRVSGGQHLQRLRASLNDGDFDLADCSIETIGVLRDAWSAIKPLQDCNDAPLFLPGEVGPISEGLPLRKADDLFDPYPALEQSQSAAKAAARKTGKRKRSNNRIEELADCAMRRLADGPQLTTKREHWSELPTELRELGNKLAAQAEAPATTESGSVEPTASSDDGLQIPIPCTAGKAATIEFPPGGMQYVVTHEMAEAFKKMIDAKGRPVAISGGKPLRKAKSDLASLANTAPGLTDLVERDGNRGYRLKCF